MRTRFGVPVEKIAVLPNPVDSAWLRAGSAAPRARPRQELRRGRAADSSEGVRQVDRYGRGRRPRETGCAYSGTDRTAPRWKAACGSAVRPTGFGLPGSSRSLGHSTPAPMRCSYRPGGRACQNVALEALACGTSVIATPGIGRHRGGGGCGRRRARWTIAPWGDAFRSALADVAPSPVDDTPAVAVAGTS